MRFFLFSFLSHSDDNLNTKTKDYRCFTTNDFHYWCLKVLLNKNVKLLIKRERLHWYGSESLTMSCLYVKSLLISKCKGNKKEISIYSSLPNWRVARNKRGGGKNESFLISVVPEISMVVRIFRPVTVIKRRTKWFKISN